MQMKPVYDKALNNLRDLIETTIVSFLNTESGQIIIGVDDTLTVIGYETYHIEDIFRREVVDKVVKRIQKSVMNTMYKVESVTVSTCISENT